MRFFSFVVFWFSLGTQLCAQWQPIGPFGGAVAAIQTDSRHTDTVLAATGNALLFRSSDGGDHWGSVPFPPALHAILHLFVVQPDGAYLAGLGSDSPAYSGLFRSRDEGVTWEHIEGLGGREIWSLAIWAVDPRVIAAGSRDGVHLTRDGGATWKRISPLENRELQPVVSLAFDPTDANVVFAGTPHLPWKTADGGASWRSIHTGMIDDSDVFSIQVDRNLPQHVFATACSGIYSSTNGGGLWTKLTGATGASYRTYTVAQDPRQSNLVFAGTTGGLIRSYDNGRTWRKLSGDAARFIAFDPARPGRIFVATDQQGVLRSDDNGDSLKGVNEGLCNRYFSSLAAAGGDLFTASIYEPSAGGVFRLKGDGVEWERVAAPSALSGEQILNLAGGPEAVGKGLYAATYRSVLGSSDAGKTWKRIPGPTATGRLTGLGEISGRLLLASESGLYRSENGKPWTKVMLPARAAGVRSLIPIDAKSIAATTSTGLLLSSDGISWSEASAIPGDPRIYGLVSPGAGRLLAATSAGLMQSDDLGSSWQRVHWTLENNSVSAICVHPLAPNHVYLAQFGAVYESSDAGQTWAAASSPGSSMISVRALAIVTSQPGRLYALTQHQGMFALPVSITPGGPSNSKPYQLEKYDRKRR